MPGPDRFPVLPAVRVVADPAALDTALAALDGPAGAAPYTSMADMDGPAEEVEAALDRAAHPGDHGHWSPGCHRARLAPDDLLIVLADRAGQAAAVADLAALVGPLDRHAIVEPESAFVGAVEATDQVRRWVAHHADWLLPPGDGLSQGMVAALPVKIVVAGDAALVLTPASFGPELADRFDTDRFDTDRSETDRSDTDRSDTETETDEGGPR